ncbi:MAG: deoxyribonucleoside regulator [Subtercola sp.]|nr:deoxyribonucleoside regulator [Subtercola sp.]
MTRSSNGGGGPGIHPTGQTGVMIASRRAALFEVAELYYEHDLTMNEIAASKGLSRSTVSRMLRDARDGGIVEISLNRQSDQTAELAATLTEQHGIRAHVVASSDTLSELQQLERVAAHGARLLRGMFSSEMTLVIPWGTTVATIGRNLTPFATRGSRVVQLNGSGNTFTSGIEYAGNILEMYGRAFEASVHHFPVPVFFDSASTKSAMWKERSLQRVLHIQRNADIALFSVGALASEVPGHLYRAGYLGRAELEHLAGQGVVGDLGTIFLRADGSSDRLPLNARSTGMPIRELKGIPRRVCVATGHSKVPVLRAALAASAITDLVTDERTALELAAAFAG